MSVNYFADWPFDKLNTATKYPSIPTYHKLGDRGRLTDELNVDFGDDEVVVTEKIDGTNARIVRYAESTLGPGSRPEESYLIGSRKEFLFASGDWMHNPAQHIVETVRPFADEVVVGSVMASLSVQVIYGEVYGAGIGKGGKQYSASHRGFRIFDLWQLDPFTLREFLDSSSLEEVSRWRKAGGQPFLNWGHPGFVIRPRVPKLTSEPPPRSIVDTYEWLHQFSQTLAVVDETGTGRAEGVVVRTPDRSKIAKIRFEDYRRTLR